MRTFCSKEEVWDALVRAKGDRRNAADLLDVSYRTLLRYIHDYNLFAEMDRAGMIKHKGPPRNVERGYSRRKEVILKHIKKNKGEVDYGEVAKELYPEIGDTDKTRPRVYSAFAELKAKRVIATDGIRWFVLGPVLQAVR